MARYGRVANDRRSHRDGLSDTDELPVLPEGLGGRPPTGGPVDATWVDLPAHRLLRARRRWSPLAGRGALMLAVGLAALVLPGATFARALVGLGLLGLVGGALALADAFRVEGLLRTLLFVQAAVWAGAGLAALVWPSPSSAAATVVLAGWAVAAGAVEVVAAIVGRVGKPAGRLLFLVGVVSIMLGAVLVLRRDLDAPAVVVLTGALVAVCGGLLLTAAARLRRLPRV